MTIKATCPTCAKDYQVGEKLIGKKIRCKNCQAVFVADPNPKSKIEDEEPVDVEPEESNKDKKGSSPARSKSKIKKIANQKHLQPLGFLESYSQVLFSWGVVALFGLLQKNKLKIKRLMQMAN